MWINEINTFDAMAKRCTEIERFPKGQRATGNGKRKWAVVDGGSKSSQAGNNQSTILKLAGSWVMGDGAAACLGVWSCTQPFPVQQKKRRKI